MPVDCGDLADLDADAVDTVGFGLGEGGELLVDLLGADQPVIVELAAHVAVEERLARHAVALGEAQHLAAERGQAAVVAVELVDEIFDLAGVELDALDLGGELFAELGVFLFFRRGIILADAHRGQAGLLELGEFLVERGDAGELLERHRLELFLHLGERKGVILFLFLGRARGAALVELVLVVGDGFLFLGLFLFLDGRAGILLADLVVGILAAFGVGGVDLLGGRALRQHRLEIEDLAQLHDAVVEVVRPVDDRVEGDRAFAQAPDHRVAAGLDALGDGDLALAAEQFDRAHLAQVHADRIVGAVDRFLLDRRGGARAAVVERIDLVLGFLFGSSSSSSPASTASTMLIPISLSAEVMSSIWSESNLARGQGLVELVIGDDAALLGARNQFLDRNVVEVDQGRIAAVGFGFSRVVFRHKLDLLCAA